MRGRHAAISAAAITLLIFPIVVALAPKEKPQPPAPVEGTLTARIARPSGFTSGEFETHLRILAAGPTPGPALLKNDDGVVVGHVSAESDPSKCDGFLTHDAATAASSAEEQLWCLRVTGLRPGAEVTGKLEVTGTPAPGASPQTTLTLTVDARDNYWFRPLLATAAGLLIAIVIAVWPKRLQTLVKSSLLSRTLARNRRAGPNEIKGLDDWVKAQITAGKTPEDLLPVVDGVVKDGPAKDKKARDDLKAALQGDPLGAGHPYAAAANAQTSPRTLSPSDFLKDDGTTNADPLPAAKWQAGLTTLIDRHKELDELSGDVQAFEGTSCHAEAKAAWDAADEVFKRTADPLHIAALDGQLDQLRSTIIDLRAKPQCRKPGEAAAAAAQPRTRVRSQAAALQVTAASIWTSVFGAGVAFAVTVLLVAFWVFVTIAFANYAAKPTFGRLTDYWELFVAAVGSTFAGTLFTLLAYWDPKATADDGS